MKSFTLLLAFALSSAALGAQELSPVRISQADKERAAALMSQMTLEQKCHVISGLSSGKPGDNRKYMLEGCPELGVPGIVMADGPQGVNNKQYRDQATTWYPCGVSAAASFDRDAVREMGVGLGLDSRARGVGFLLAPGVNMYRVALCGRNYEYYGEDPYLAGEMAAEYILGVQSQGIIATVKHFAVNNQEWDRFVLTSNVDERTLNEIYFPAFRKAIEKGGVGALMTACGRLNGSHCSENAWLLKKTLREDWGYEGVTMCDWQTMFSTLNGIQGGNDIEMPEAYIHKYERVQRLMDNGVLTMQDIDEKCLHVLQTLSAFGLLDRPLKDETIPFDNSDCHRRAYEAAAEGPVLVKNNGILPIRKSARNKILLTGPYADKQAAGGGCGWVKAFDGAYITTWKGMQNLGKGYATTLQEAPEDDAVRLASAVIVEVGYGNRIEGENHDHEFALPERQEQLLQRLTALSDKVIVLIHSGCEVDMRAWGDKAAAIIYAWYGGEHTGTVLSEIIAGKISPSGRLPFTMWGSFENNPCSETYLQDDFIAKKIDRPRFTQSPHCDYREGVFMGYRAIEHFGRVPLYPFGYGLSYSSFGYEDLQIQPSGEGWEVSFLVRNTGKCAAATVPQVYVAPQQASVPRPVRELKQFTRVQLNAGEQRRVSLYLAAEAFSHYDVCSHSWVTDKGSYAIQLGENEQHILLEQTINL